MAKSKKAKKYNVDWFLKFFQKIPKKKWTTKISENKKGQFCAIGHLARKTKEKDAYNNPVVQKLDKLFMGDLTWHINDNRLGYFKHLGKHPKNRIVNALKRVKKGLSLYRS